MAAPARRPLSCPRAFMVSWMPFAASVPTCDGPVTLIGQKKKSLDGEKNTVARKSKRRATNDTSRHDAHHSILTTPDVERYTTRNHKRSQETTTCHHKCVGQHQIARRRAPAKDAQTMAAMAADLLTGRNRKDRSCLTAQVKAKPSGSAVTLVMPITAKSEKR